jgi:hypothetical protein
LGFLTAVPTVFRPHSLLEQKQATDHKRSSVGHVFFVNSVEIRARRPP